MNSANSKPQPAPPTAPPGITELEKPGILMTRMLHELTNCLSVLAGHVQLFELQSLNPQIADSLRSIKWASNELGEIVERYATFRRQIPRAPHPCSLEELCAALQLGHPETPADPLACDQTWTLVPPARPIAYLDLETRWLRYAIWELARNSGSTTGRIQLYGPDETFDRRGLKSMLFNPSKKTFLHILVSWPSEKPALGEHDLFKPPNMSLALTVGLIRWAYGQACYGFIEPGENRFWIVLPAAKNP